MFHIPSPSMFSLTSYDFQPSIFSFGKRTSNKTRQQVEQDQLDKIEKLRIEQSKNDKMKSKTIEGLAASKLQSDKALRKNLIKSSFHKI